MTSGGYFAPQAGWWRQIRERLPRPWGREEALTDLRWWQDQVLSGAERRMPPYRSLAEHWGWGEKKARLLLQSEEEWSDPHKAEAWRAQTGRNEGASGAHQGRNEGATDPHAHGVDSDTGAQTGRNEGARGAQEGPAKGHTRGDPQTQTPAPHEKMADLVLLPPPPAEPDPYAEAASYWEERVLPALGRESGCAPGRDTKLGRELARSLKRDPASVMDAMRFVAEGSADRAAFLRDRYAKSVTVKTVLTHLDEYAELWRAEGTGPPARAAPAYHRAPQPEPEAEIRRPPPRSTRP